MEKFQVLFYFLLNVIPVLAMVSSDHPCNRACLVDQTKTCEYHLSVENYLTLSKACYNCPWNTTDCFRPHCITGNGAKRPVLAINRQIPGPPIEVCKGDKVVVIVENKLEDGSSISLHWHGVHQNYTNFMDGVPGLTQCNILPYETFRYEFTANNSGTHWYHSHTGLQLGDGLYGAFIVREPVTMNPHHSLYNVDSGNHVMVLADWQDRLQIIRFMEEIHDAWSLPIPHLSITVNGRGRQHKVDDVHNITKSGTTVPTFTPMEVFTVESNQRYRFRMISAATMCFFKVMIDNHYVTVIAADGQPIQPVQVGVIIIHPGERYDFILRATEAPGDYWIKLLSLGVCSPTGGFHAILHYDGYQGNTDMMPTADPDDFENNRTVLNGNQFNADINKISLSELKSEKFGEDANYTDEHVDVRKYIDLRFLSNDNSIYNRLNLYPASSRLGMFTPTLNNITMKLGPVPLSTQWYDVENKELCNDETIDTANDCNEQVCHCCHMYSFELGQVVEFFMVGFVRGPHPMHLHGYTFRVVGSGLISEDKNAYQRTVLGDIIARDNAGEFPRNLVNPLKKDTVTVPAFGGYTIIRFKADNPEVIRPSQRSTDFHLSEEYLEQFARDFSGIWFFHCHNEGHMLLGMSLAIKVGNPSQFPRPSTFFPKCGGYLYQPSHECDNSTSGTGGFKTPILMLSIVLDIGCFIVRYLDEF